MDRVPSATPRASAAAAANPGPAGGALLPLATPWPRDEEAFMGCFASTQREGSSTVDAYAHRRRVHRGRAPFFLFHAGSHLLITSDWPSL